MSLAYDDQRHHASYPPSLWGGEAVGNPPYVPVAPVSTVEEPDPEPEEPCPPDDEPPPEEPPA